MACPEMVSMICVFSHEAICSSTCVFILPTGDPYLHLRLLFHISLTIRGSFSHSDSLPHLSFRVPGHQPLLWDCFPLQSLSRISSLNQGVYICLFFPCLLHLGLLLRCFHVKMHPSLLISCSNFLDLSKILPNTCFLRPGPEKLSADFHPVSSSVETWGRWGEWGGLLYKIFVFPK